jgi:hypothetical protein
MDAGGDAAADANVDQPFRDPVSRVYRYEAGHGTRPSSAATLIIGLWLIAITLVIIHRNNRVVAHRHYTGHHPADNRHYTGHPTDNSDMFQLSLGAWDPGSN